MANLDTFVSNLAGGGARANQFTVTIVGGAAPGGMETVPFLCRSAQIPAMTIGEVAVPYRGRQVFVAGDRTFDAWTITVFSDAAMALRKSFETWQNNIARSGTGFDATHGALSTTDYYATAHVVQQYRIGVPAASYKLLDVWPQTVDAIDLAWDTNDAIMEFGVTLRFNYMKSDGIGTGA
jgi:hypothetical protein